MEGGKDDNKLPDIFTLVAGMTSTTCQASISTLSTVPPTPATSPSDSSAMCEMGSKEEPVIQPISPAHCSPGDEAVLQEYGCGPDDIHSLASWYFLGYPSNEPDPDPRVDFYSAGPQLTYGGAFLQAAHDYYSGGGEDGEGEGARHAVNFLTHQDEDPSLAAASLPHHTHASTLADLRGAVYSAHGGAVSGGGVGGEGEAWLTPRAPPAGLLGDSGYLSEWSDSPHASTHSSSTVSTPERHPPPQSCLGGPELEEALELPRFPHEALRQLTLTDPSLLRPMPHPSLTQLAARPDPPGPSVGMGTRRKVQSNNVSSPLTRGHHPSTSQHPPATTSMAPVTRSPLREMSNASSRLKRRCDSLREETSAEKRSRHNQPLNNNAIRVMTDWYETHLDHPYPTKLEKAQLAAEGGITVMQVKSWFANKRNRSNNTRPKVQKKMLEEKLQNLCQQLAAMSRQSAAVDSSYLIQQLSALIRQ